jgi:hypothetical protein
MIFIFFVIYNILIPRKPDIYDQIKGSKLLYLWIEGVTNIYYFFERNMYYFALKQNHASFDDKHKKDFVSNLYLLKKMSGVTFLLLLWIQCMCINNNYTFG